MQGKRLLAGESFLFGTKKEAKKCRRFEAAAADQGCGFLPEQLCCEIVRSTMQKPTHSVGSYAIRPRKAANGWGEKPCATEMRPPYDGLLRPWGA